MADIRQNDDLDRRIANARAAEEARTGVAPAGGPGKGYGQGSRVLMELIGAPLGGGVIGVTSAWYLSQAGHEVVLIDRQSSVAQETSFANAGEISPGYASPWAAPGIPAKALRWLFMQHAPLILRPNVDMAMLRWMIAMLGNCNAADYRINKGRMVRLAEYSRDQLIALRAATGIS